MKLKAKEIKKANCYYSTSKLKKLLSIIYSKKLFSVVNVSFNEKDNSFENISKVVKEEFTKALDKDNIKAKMNSTINLENIFIVRLVPVILKDFVLKLAYKIASKYQTMTLSNIELLKCLKFIKNI